MIGGADFVAKEDWGAAHTLLDDPAALRHAGDQLQHVVAPAVGHGIVQITLQKPATPCPVWATLQFCGGPTAKSCLGRNAACSNSLM